MIEPIVGPIWVWIFVAEYPGVPALIGGSIVFVALAVHTLLRRVESCGSAVVDRVDGDAGRDTSVDRGDDVGAALPRSAAVSSDAN